MTPLILQTYLIGTPDQKTGKCYGGLLEFVLKEWKDHNNKSLNFYEHFPAQRMEEGDYSHYPLCYTILRGGADNKGSSMQELAIAIMTYDSDESYHGYRDCMNAIERVRQYLNEYPNLNDEVAKNFNPSIMVPFQVQYPIQWEAPFEEEGHPIYTGGLLLKFEIPSIKQIIPDIYC